MRLCREEALRYLGAAGADNALRQAMEEAAAWLEARITPRWVYRVFHLTAEEGGVNLAGARVTLTGCLAQTLLTDCRQAALLACTLGQGWERLMREEQARDMARAVILDACASAYVEAGCDAAQAEVAARMPGLHLTDRFSPGYGDLPLSLQPAILTALDASRRLGLHATPTYLLLPQKSVTAVIGLAERPQGARIRGCPHCDLREHCTLRQRGGCGV